MRHVHESDVPLVLWSMKVNLMYLVFFSVYFWFCFFYCVLL